MHVVQGLIDAHVHMLIGGSSLQQIDLRGIASKAAFVAAVKDAAGGLAFMRIMRILHSVLLGENNTKTLFSLGGKCACCNPQCILHSCSMMHLEDAVIKPTDRSKCVHTTRHCLRSAASPSSASCSSFSSCLLRLPQCVIICATEAAFS